MPRRFYQHLCKGNDLRMINWSPCNVCGAPGVYSGWGYSRIESWGHFTRLFGLPPYGLHKPWVETLGLTQACSPCGGKGLFDIDSGSDYASCGVCEGGGRVLTCSAEDLEAVQQIARVILDQHNLKPWLAGDHRPPVERVLALISDEPLRVSAQRLLEERRFTEVVRILTWQGIPDLNTTSKAASDLEDDEDEDDEEIPPDIEDRQAAPCAWQKADAVASGPYRRLDPPGMEEISGELDRLRDLGLLGD